MNRRSFLRLGAGAALAAVNWRLWAAPTGGSNGRFLLVFLRGAYDALSAVVPYAEPFYYEARPHIALARPSERDPDAVIALDGRWGLNPALQDSLLPLYEAGELAFVPFAGTAFVSRSHFQAQDWIEFGHAPGTQPNPNSGFLNRLLAQLGAGGGRRPDAVSFTRTLPPVLRGGLPVANTPVRVANRRRISAGYEALLEEMYAGHPLEPMVRDGLSLRREISKELAEEMQTASRDAMPASGFALEAARIGRLLRDRPEYNIGFIDIGGWDTHAAQGAARGALSGRLHDLGEGLAELAEALGPEWKRTVVVVMSEFGRTFRENGSKGTDHGHGSTLWVLGGSVRGGAIRGEQAPLGPGDLHQNRDLPVLNEYRATLAGLFARLYGLDGQALAEVFPQARPIDLGLV